MVYIKECSITSGRDSLQNISDEINNAINESNVVNGVVVVETTHSTCGILKISKQGNEILEDITKEMRRLIPARINYKHQESPENAAGHIKSSLFGTSVSLIVKDGKLLCNDKQDIYFADYDGPRVRKYTILVYGG